MAALQRWYYTYRAGGLATDGLQIGGTAGRIGRREVGDARRRSPYVPEFDTSAAE